MIPTIERQRLSLLLEHQGDVMSEMVLFHAPRSPFSYKTRIVVHAVGWSDRIHFAQVDPWTDECLRRINPLCKVPTLRFPDGSALLDSRTICEHLADEAGGALFPAGHGRAAVRSGHALADGLAEAVIRRFVESKQPHTEYRDRLVARQELAISAALDRFERLLVASEFPAFTLADAALCAALTYMSFRSPEIVWRSRCFHLSRWFDRTQLAACVVAAGFPISA